MNSRSDVHDLIKSLNAAERRHFQALVQRNKRKNEAVTLKLFNAMLEQDTYDEAALSAKFAGAAFLRQFPVAKHALASMLLKSLEDFHDAETPLMQTRSIANQVELLLEKGLWEYAGRLAGKGRKIAAEYGLLAEELDFVRAEMRIDKRNLDERGMQRLKLAWAREDALIAMIQQEHQLRRFHDQLLGMLQRQGQGEVANSEADRIGAMPVLQIPPTELPFTLRNVHRYCHVYLHQLRGELEGVVDRFEEMVTDWNGLEQFQKLYPDRYTTTHLSYLNALLRLPDTARFEAALQKTDAFLAVEGRSAPRAFAMTFNLELQYLLRTLRPPIHAPIEAKIKEGLAHHGEKIEPALRLSLMYNLAIYLFIEGDCVGSLRWVRQILNLRQDRIRLDIRDFANAMQMILLFEQGEFAVLEYRVAAIKRISKATAATGALVRAIAEILGRILVAETEDLGEEFANGLAALLSKRGQIGEEALGWPVAEYWLRSHVESCSVLEIAKRHSH